MFYLDNAATTPLLPEVVDKMTAVLTDVYGNPSSTHQMGRMAKQELSKAREIIARSINAKASDIVFTSGATESNNAILSFLVEKSNKKHVITTKIEHPSVLNYCQYLETQGYQVTYLSVDTNGVISLDELKNSVTEQTGVISVMAVNNETGAIQPLEAVATFAQEKGIYCHSDMVQAYGVLQIDVTTLPLDAMSFSAHKIHGPKGVGCLYVKSEHRFSSLFHGGSQEFSKRPGTENIAGIAGFAMAVSQLSVVESVAHYRQLQHYFIKRLNEVNVPYQLNGSLDEHYKVPKILNLWFKDMPAQKLLIQLDLNGICVSAGSACSAGSLQPSHVLKVQYPQEIERANQSIRVSFSPLTTIEEIEWLVENLARFTV